MKNKYKAEVKVGTDAKWYSNALRFKTKKEAEEYGEGLFNRWMMDRRVNNNERR